MSLENARHSLKLAAEASSGAAHLGHLCAARVSLNAAIKSGLAEAVLADAGQEQLPLGDPPPPPGPPVTVDGNGVVMTPADEVEASLVTPEGDVTTKRRRIPRRAPHPIDSALPTEAEHDAAVAAAAAAAVEPEWATV